MAISQTQLESLYLAYFGRPADFDGLVFYTSNPAFDVWSVAAAFSASPESQALYGTGFSASTINAIYQNLFNRDAEPAGLLYWSTEVASGRLTAAGAAYAIFLGAQNEDAITVQNKMAASAAFTAALDTAPEIIGYSGNDAAAAARAWLATVTADPATLTAALAGVDAAVAAVVAVGGTIGQSYTLSTGVDTITITDATTINTVSGVIDADLGNGNTSTFSVGDAITGNGKTILNLAVAEASGDAAFATVKNVSQVNLIAGDSGWLDLNAVNWSGIGSVNLTNGVDGLSVWVEDLNAGAGLSVGAGVSGSISASYTNDIGAWMYSDRGSSVGYVNGAVTGVVDAGGTASASFWANEDSTAITIGDVSITAAGNDGDDAYFAVYNSENKGGDIMVGNVTMTGFTSDISFTIENTNHTASSTAVNVSVGNVTLAGVGSASVEMDISNTSSGAVGNLTIGNVALSTGKDGYISASVENYGRNTVGNLTMGSLSVAAGVDAYATVDISNSVWSSGTKAATVGTTTIGAIAMNLAQSATGYLEFSADASSYGTGKATVGAVSIGTINAVLAQDAYGSVDIDVSAYSSGGAAAVGDVSIGAASFMLAVDATAYLDVSVTANAGAGAATIGNVTTGGVSVSAGINTFFSAENEINAYGSTSSAIGNITNGDVSLAGDDGATLWYSNDVYSAGKIGNVALNNLTATLGVSASAWAGNYVSADKSIGNYSVGNVSATAGKNSSFWATFEADANGGSLGTVSIGDVNMTAGATADYAGVSFSMSASTNIGNVSVGNTTLTAGKNSFAYASYEFYAGTGSIGTMTVGDVNVSSGATTGTWWQDGAHYYLFANAETAIGDVTVGNVNLSAVGAGARAYASMTWENNSGGGTIGNVNIGNVTSTVNGANAYGGFYVSVSNADTGGTLTIGNLNLTTGNAAAKTGAYLEIDAYNYLGAVVVGDITLTASGVRDGSTTDLRTYDADVNLYGETTVTVGNITVTGGDGKAEDFGTLTNWLTLVGNTGAETIGGVDYSGYGAAATLDVSGYLGAAFVIGGAKADTITDNKGTNALTGNGGADTFVFLNTNTGVTLATMDSITDFSNSAGDRIDLTLTGGVLDTTRYGENSFADFAAFVTGSNAGNKAVFVGQIGSDSYVAVDHNEDNTVDFMIKLTGVSLSQIDVASFV